MSLKPWLQPFRWASIHHRDFNELHGTTNGKPLSERSPTCARSSFTRFTAIFRRTISANSRTNTLTKNSGVREAAGVHGVPTGSSVDAFENAAAYSPRVERGGTGGSIARPTIQIFVRPELTAIQLVPPVGALKNAAVLGPGIERGGSERTDRQGRNLSSGGPPP